MDVTKSSTHADFDTNAFPGANSLCDGKVRVRRDWDLISKEERELFLQAVESAIDQGLIQEFVKYHADPTSALQAHNSCAFLLWHRRYTLALENMLRSLGPEFVCLTLPWWNIMEHHISQENKDCHSYSSCSRVVNEIGGPPLYSGERRKFAGNKAEGYLVSGRPFTRLLDDDGHRGIVRADLILAGIPSRASYNEVLSAIGTASTYRNFSHQIEKGIHDSIHDTLGGFMPTYSSPIDSLFMIWHSTIDLLFYLWHICHVPLPMSMEERLHSVYAFDQEKNCMYDPQHGHNGPNPFINLTSSDDMYMKTADGIDVRENPMIGKFFQDVGLQYAEVVDVRILGENEFSYDHITQPILEMLMDPTQCTLDPSWSTFPTQSPTSSPPTPPTPGKTEIQLVLAHAKEELEELYPNNPEKASHLYQYLSCTIRRENRLATEEFLEEFLANNVTFDPACAFFLPDLEETDETTVTPTKYPASASIVPTNIDEGIDSLSSGGHRLCSVERTLYPGGNPYLWLLLSWFALFRGG